jgi:hypothetical protein
MTLIYKFFYHFGDHIIPVFYSLTLSLIGLMSFFLDQFLRRRSLSSFTAGSFHDKGKEHRQRPPVGKRSRYRWLTPGEYPNGSPHSTPFTQPNPTKS